MSRTRSVVILKAITDVAMGFDPAGELAVRQEALDRWIGWYFENRPDRLLR